MKKIISIMAIAILSLGALAGCGSNSESKDYESGQLSGVYQSVLQELYGTEIPSFMEATDGPTVEGLTGITEDMYTEALVAMPMMNINVDTFIGFEGKPEQVEEIQGKLEEYKEKTIADREAFPYLPDHLPKAKAAQVVTYGNYVFYISMANVPMETPEGDLQSVVDAGVQTAIETIENTLK